MGREVTAARRSKPALWVVAEQLEEIYLRRWSAVGVRVRSNQGLPSSIHRFKALAVNWFIGIDGGGSHTRALIVNSAGAVMGSGEGGSSNYHTVGLSQAVRAVAEAVSGAKMQARLAGPAAGAFLGLAGVKTAADHLAFREPLAALQLVKAPQNLALDHDLRIALAGGCGEEPGLVVVSGTGAAGYGRDREGHTAQVGGWGWLIDDQGGGVWMAVQGLRAVMEAADGRGAYTRLEPALFAELGVTTHREAMQWAQRPDTARAQLAALAPVVLAAAADDEVARVIVREGARQLARVASALVARLAFAESPVTVVAAGGLLGNETYSDPFREELAKAVPRHRLVANPPPPIVGAAVLAAHLGGTPLSAQAIVSLAADYRRRRG